MKALELMDGRYHKFVFVTNSDESFSMTKEEKKKAKGKQYHR